MSCLLNNGYEKGCRDNIGGVLKVYIGNFDEDQTYTMDSETDEITGITSSVDYYTFEQEMETSSFTQEGQYSTENGTVFFDQQLSLVFHKNDTELRNLLIVLSQGNLSVIVVDQRNNKWLMGLQNGVRAISGTQNSGQAFGDMNGVNITLQGKEPEPANKVDDAAIDELTIDPTT